MNFSDNVGIFIAAMSKVFQALQACLSMYQLVSGAKLNTKKPIIIPISLEDIPA
jgi:hypothetical protein